MTHDKARDFFSAYHEGTLDPAVRLSFEHKLNGDTDLRDEYAQFEATITQLSGLRDSEIEVPFDLNERISARLDRHLWEQKQAAPSSFFSRFRTLGLVGIAAVALIGAAFSLRNHGGPSVAGFVPTESDHLTVSVRNDAVTVSFHPASRSTVVLRSEPEGKPFAQLVADSGVPLSKPISNANASTELISIQVMDAPESEHIVLALPGTRSEKINTASGTIEDLARVLAAKYRVPVTLTGIDPLIQVSWDLTAPDARQAAEAALKGGHYSVDQREGNLITISRG